MSLTPAEFLESLDDAIADTPWWRPGKVALELTQRRVLGEVGQPIERAYEDVVYGFTRRQCERMRDSLLAAARADAGAAP